MTESPYTVEQLLDIAESLGLGTKFKHEAVDRVVGIARTLGKQRADKQPDFIKRQAVAAKEASKLEFGLYKIYRIFPDLGSAAEALRRARSQIRFHNENKETTGRKPPDHIITALIQLYAVWRDLKGKQEAEKEKFIGAALNPLGYDTNGRAFDSHRKQALAILNRKN